MAHWRLEISCILYMAPSRSEISIFWSRDVATFNVVRMSFELFTPIVFVVTVIARYFSCLLFSCDVEYCRCYSMLLLLSNNVVLCCVNFCLQLFLFDVVVLLLFLFVRSNFGCCLYVAGMIYTSCFCQSWCSYSYIYCRRDRCFGHSRKSDAATSWRKNREKNAILIKNINSNISLKVDSVWVDVNIVFNIAL